MRPFAWVAFIYFVIAGVGCLADGRLWYGTHSLGMAFFCLAAFTPDTDKRTALSDRSLSVEAPK